MIKSYFYHLQVNINFKKNIQFYTDLMEFLGWKRIFEEGEDQQGFKSNTNGDIWFVQSLKNDWADYDNVGLSHFAIRVKGQSDVDKVLAFIKSKGTKALFDTPRHRPEFASTEKETYYQIIFESPDKIQIEIVYIGPKI